MTRRYQTIWRRAEYLRNDPRAFTEAYVELQHELEREARETLRVQGLRMAWDGRPYDDATPEGV